MEREERFAGEAGFAPLPDEAETAPGGQTGADASLAQISTGD